MIGRQEPAAAMLGVSLPAGADAALIEAARREGALAWYSTLIVNQITRPLSLAFEKKYPGIKVQYSRASSSDVALKITNEARAGRIQADVFDGSNTIFPLQDAGLVEPYLVDSARSYPADFRDKAGLWTTMNVYYLTVAYNTDLVKGADIPRSYDDLLNPKWAGKMAWTTDPTANGPPGFIQNILALKGETKGMEYLKALAAQKPVNIPAAQRVVLDKVIAGEFPIGLMTFNHHAAISAAKGAPVAWARTATSLVVGAVLAVLMLPPLLMLVQGSLVETDATGRATAWTLGHFQTLFTTPGLATTLWNSLVFSAGSTVLSLLVGGVLAWLVERTNAPLRFLATITTIISMGTPYILHVVAWLFLLGPVGPLNNTWKAAGGTGKLIEVQSMWGMILIEGFLWSPLVFLLLGATFRAANADMEEAARTSGAGVLATVWRISIRLAMPAILALALFVFIRSIGAFEVPALVGIPSRIYVLTTAVYESMTTMPPNLGHASAFAVVMVVIVAVLLLFYSRLSANAERYHSVTGKGYRPRPFDLGGWRWLAGGLILLNFAIVLLAPMLALVWMALQSFPRAFSMAGLKTLTWSNFTAVIDAPNYLDLALNSLLVAAGAATAIMLLAAFAGWIAARRGPGGRTIDQLATLSLVFPGIVLGVAVMEVYLRVPLPIYGTLWIILIAYVIRFMPFGMRYVYSGVLQLHSELEEAAGVSGAGYLTILRRIVAPLLTPAMVAGWLFIFLIANKELAIAILLASPGSQVAAVAVFDLWVNGQGGELAAFGLMWTVLMTAVAVLFFVQSRRGRTDIWGN